MTKVSFILLPVSSGFECWSVNHSSKYFNVISTLLLGKDQRQRWNLQRLTMLNQRCLFRRQFEQRKTTSKKHCHFQRFLQRCEISKQLCEYNNLQKSKNKLRAKNITAFLNLGWKPSKMNTLNSTFSILYSPF